MKIPFQSYVQYGSTYCGVEIVSTDGKEEYHSVSANNKKGEFVDLNFSSSKTLDDLNLKNKHCHLVINTDQILIKEAAYHEDIHKVLAQTFPSLVLQDFYYNAVQCGDKYFIAICKKEIVQKTLGQFTSNKIQVLSFQLVFSPIIAMAKLINEQKLVTSNFEFTKQKNIVTGFEATAAEKKTYIIDDIHVSSDHLIATAALTGYNSSHNVIGNTNETNSLLKKSFNEKVFFKKGGVLALGIILLLTLCNLFFYTSLFKDHNSLQEKLTFFGNQKEQYTNKLNEVNKKEQLVNSIQNSSNSKGSYYLNRIVCGMPNTIILKEYSHHPLRRNIRGDKIIEVKEEVITVYGESADEEIFSDWIEGLEKTNWIKKIDIIQYQNISKSKEYFEIKIDYTHEAEE